MKYIIIIWEMVTEVDIRQLKYFQAIAEEGQISKAARRLHMAQPPLSLQLKQLETELGVMLVERGSRQVKLTDAGRLLQERATQLIELMNVTTAQLQDLSSGSRGTLSIGAVASAGTTFLPDRIQKFHSQYPEVTFQFWEGNTARILELLQSGVVEIGIARSVFDPRLYQSHSLPPEPLVAAQRPNPAGGTPGTPPRISVADLADKPLLIHRSNEVMIADCCRQYGFEPKILCRGDDMRSLLVWADAGVGMAIVTQSAVGLVPSQHLIYHEIAEPALTIQKAIIWYRSHYLSSIAKNFLASLLATQP